MIAKKELSFRSTSRRRRILETSALVPVLSAAIIAAGAGMAYADGSGFDSLPTGGTGSSSAGGISGNGLVGVGFYSNTTDEPFSWSLAGGAQALAYLNGGENAQAVAVNYDGSVIVGNAEDGDFEDDRRAVRWTNGGSQIESLGTLTGGVVSYATAVSSDGSVVAGYGDTADTFKEAFRWTEQAGMQGLGFLTGGNNSQANAISGDGSVVVGESNTNSQVFSVLSISPQGLAFRWTEGTGMVSLGTLQGGDNSSAYGANSDGSVIVGESDSAEGQRAFRWTSGAGMVSLGVIGVDARSEAKAVNGDGSVVVGDSAGLDGERAFRWTQATGMITVEQWMRDNGVNVADGVTETAVGVSSDGNVVVGNTNDSGVFIARVVPSTPDTPDAPTKSGIIDVEQYNTTLAAKPTTQVGLSYANTVLQGAHGEPMRDLLTPGQRSFSVTSDLGYDDSHTSKGGLGIGDVTLGYGLADGITARFAAGGLYTRQDIDTGGHFRNDAFYFSPEASIALGDSNVYATVGGYYSSGKMSVHRGYLNGSDMDYSDGDTDVDAWGGKIRFDWLNAATIADVKLTPYASLTYAHSHMDGYVEHGGSFPSEFDAIDDHSTVARIGIDYLHELNPGLRLTARTEVDYRFENKTAGTSGQILGLSDFSFDGEEVRKLWVRGAVGTEFDIAGGTASLGVNVTTEGDDPDVWLRSGWRMKF